MTILIMYFTILESINRTININRSNFKKRWFLFSFGNFAGHEIVSERLTVFISLTNWLFGNRMLRLK